MRAGVEERDWGRFFFFSARPKDNVFNRASATGPGLFDHLDEILEAFAARQAPAFFEMNYADLAGDFQEEGLARAIEKGFRPHSVEGIFYGETDRTYAPSSEDVVVTRAETLEEKVVFWQTYAKGWQSPPDHAQTWQKVALDMFDDPAFSGFVAWVDGTPAGCAQLYVHEGVGYYADACVDPAFRRRGCQRALFNARLEAARAAGCDLVFSIAEFADQSANNMEAFGLRLASELHHWTKS